MKERFVAFRQEEIAYLENGNETFVEGNFLLPTFCLGIICLCTVVGGSCIYLGFNTLYYNYILPNGLTFESISNFTKKNFLLIFASIGSLVMLFANLYLSFCGAPCKGKAVSYEDYDDHRIVRVEFQNPAGEIISFKARSGKNLEAIKGIIENEKCLVILYVSRRFYRNL